MCDSHQHAPHRRRFLAGTLGAGISLATAPLLQAANRQVFVLEGDAWINGRNADFHSVIKPGDLITTGSDSLIVFKVKGDAFMLRSESRLQLEAERGFLDVLRLITGGLLATFEKGRERKIQTPIATAGIRGTALYLEAQPTELYFCNCYGEIALDAKGGDSELITSEYHNARMVRQQDDGEAKIETSAFQYHTNAELDFLDSIVGRRPPFRDKPRG